MTRIKRIRINEMLEKFNEGKKTKLTREELALQIGTSYSLINNLQNGRVGKGYQILLRLSTVLGCTVDDLIEKE